MIGIGGVASAPLSRAGDSSFGSEQVDLFAAGVAALVWAADPSCSASDVEDALFANAKSRLDAKVGVAFGTRGSHTLTLSRTDPQRPSDTIDCSSEGDRRRDRPAHGPRCGREYRERLRGAQVRRHRRTTGRPGMPGIDVSGLVQSDEAAPVARVAGRRLRFG